MAEHTISIIWERGDSSFKFEDFDRNHKIQFPGGQSLQASSAPGYMGDPQRANPEESLLASVSSCHMLTVLAIAAKKKMVVDRYEDKPHGTLAPNRDGRMMVNRITLRPKIIFAGEQPPRDVIEKLHESAHKHCFIANSLLSKQEILIQE